MKPDILNAKVKFSSKTNQNNLTANNLNYNTLISSTMSFTSSLRLWHWNTSSYAEHKAFEETEATLRDLMDTLVENANVKINISSVNLYQYFEKDKYISSYLNELKNINVNLDPSQLDVQDIIISMI